MDYEEEEDQEKCMKIFSAFLNKNGNKNTEVAKNTALNKKEEKTYEPIPKFWTNEEYNKETYVPWNIKLQKMVETHFILEKIEKDLANQEKQTRYISKNKIDSFKSQSKNIYYSSEADKSTSHKSYHLVNEQQKIPNFWAPRVYDNPSGLSTKHKERDLQQNVKNSNFVPSAKTVQEETSYGIPEMHHESETMIEMPSLNPSKKSNLNLCVELSLLEFATDGDEDLTELSDY